MDCRTTACAAFRKYIAGVNTPSSIININETRLLTRGSFNAIRIDPNLRDPRVHDWNLTLEKGSPTDTVVRIGFVGNHTVRIQQSQSFNDSTPAYIWYVTRRTPLPVGEFANVATRPYDQKVYGSINQYNSTGLRMVQRSPV